jgi:Na+(H+)/acetate symporter ActP
MKSKLLKFLLGVTGGLSLYHAVLFLSDLYFRLMLGNPFLTTDQVCGALVFASVFGLLAICCILPVIDDD